MTKLKIRDLFDPKKLGFRCQIEQKTPQEDQDQSPTRGARSAIFFEALDQTKSTKYPI
jgi:hypothetical protein